MTTQTLLTLSQVTIALGLIVSAIGGYGAYHFKERLDAEKDASVRPVVDLCHRGITVTESEPGKLYFDIPYCAGKNVNAFNVKLKPAVILRVDDDFDYSLASGTAFLMVSLSVMRLVSRCTSPCIQSTED